MGRVARRAANRKPVCDVAGRIDVALFECDVDKFPFGKPTQPA